MTAAGFGVRVTASHSLDRPFATPTGQSSRLGGAASFRWWIGPPGSAPETRRRPCPTLPATGGVKRIGYFSGPWRRRPRWRSRRRRPRRRGGWPVTPSSGATSGPSPRISPSCPSRYTIRAPPLRFSCMGERHTAFCYAREVLAEMPPW